MMQIFTFLINNSTITYKDSLTTHATFARPILYQGSSVLYLQDKIIYFTRSTARNPNHNFRMYNIYEGESIIIRTVCFIFRKTRAEILQLHNFSTQSPCFTMHFVHHRTICFMTSE